MGSRQSTQPERDRLVADLEALVSALDRRVPHIERLGEAAIAREAAVLKGKALDRINELRRDTRMDTQ
jgi:pyruvate-formate lyase